MRPSTCSRRPRAVAGRLVRDLADVVERLGVVALVRSADKGADNKSDRISDELFSVRQVVDGHGDLRSALSDPSRSPDDKRELLERVFGDKVQPATLMLVTQAASGAHGSFDRGLEEFQHLAAEAAGGAARDRAHGARSRRLRARAAAPRRSRSSTAPPCTCRSWSTLTSSAAFGSRSATTSSTARSPAGSRTLNASSPAEPSRPPAPGQPQLEQHRTRSKREEAGT